MAVRYLIGEKGTGKTKRLIDMANNAATTSEGNLVFIDDDSRHMYELHRNVRFVETSNYHISSYSEFLGFICGILSQNNDILEIFIDGLTNIVGTMDSEAILSFSGRLDELATENGVKFFISNNMPADTFPAQLKSQIIQ